MRGWRFALAGSVVILAAQVVHASDLVDVVHGGAPAGAALSYPILHIVLAPFTLLADYLNAGSTADLKAFATWSLLLYVLVRLSRRSDAKHEARALVIFLAAFALFLGWGTYWTRPIARLVVQDSNAVVFDIHSHSAASHDGRRGFSEATNARWHAKAGFDVAFLTDHNVFGAARQWQHDRAGHPPRLLNGEELSLNGLHMIVLGNDSLIANKPWDQSFDSSLALISLVARPSPTVPDRPYVIASLPEYARNHWGPDLGRIVSAGTEGLEIWTTSPKAMDFTPARRAEVIARAHSLGVALFGATDMHGLGHAASVWNVVPLPGWRRMTDSALTRALVTTFRGSPGAIRVLARPHVLGATRLARAFALPLGVVGVLRSATRAHALALLAWLWLPVLLRAPRMPRATA